MRYRSKWGGGGRKWEEGRGGTEVKGIKETEMVKKRVKKGESEGIKIGDAWGRRLRGRMLGEGQEESRWEKESERKLRGKVEESIIAA